MTKQTCSHDGNRHAATVGGLMQVIYHSEQGGVGAMALSVNCPEGLQNAARILNAANTVLARYAPVPITEMADWKEDASALR